MVCRLAQADIGRSRGFIKHRYNRLLATSLLTPVLALGTFGIDPSLADDNVISNVVTTQNGGFPLDGDDSLTITETGEINTTTDDAVVATGDNNIIFNLGSISTTGDDDYGIFFDSSNNNIFTNSGSMSTSGIDAYGIYLNDSDNNFVTNSGSHSTMGGYSLGIYINDSDDNIFINSGNISTMGEASYGIYLYNSDNNIVTNSADISTTGRIARGMYLSYSNNNIVTNSGSISTAGEYSSGMYLRNSDNNVFINSGSILTSGDDALGMFLYASDDNIFINSGNISTTGRDAGGMYLSYSNNNIVTNSADISTTGPDARGMYFSYSNNNIVTNSGSISTAGEYGRGMYLRYSENNVFINSGSISTMGNDAYGIFVQRSDNNFFTNTGSISTMGSDAYGIYLNDSDENNFTSSGRIWTSGFDASGIYLIGSNNNIFNITGTLVSEQSHAIEIDDLSTGNIFNFTTNAFLGGAIDLGAGGNFVNITTMPGQSIVWDFGAGSNITDGIQTSGPGYYRVDGNVFYFVDPTAFVGRSDALGDTAGILSGIAASRLGPNGGNGSEQEEGFAYHHADTSGSVSDTVFWSDVIGRTSEYGATSASLGYESQHVGFAIGAERDFDIATTIGLMGGYLKNEMTPESQALASLQTAETSGGFTGVYGSHDFAGQFTLSGALIAGRTQNASTRSFNSNLAGPSFIETATASYDSTFLAPSISFSKDFAITDGATLTPILSAFYAHQWSDAYTETGSSNNLTVGSTKESLLEGKAELALTQHMENTDLNTGGQVTARVGGFMREKLDSGAPTLSVAGVGALSNVNSGQDALLAITAGLDFNLNIRNDMTFTTTGDLSFGKNDYFSAQGKMGLRVRF